MGDFLDVTQSSFQMVAGRNDSVKTFIMLRVERCVDGITIGGAVGGCVSRRGGGAGWVQDGSRLLCWFFGYRLSKGSKVVERGGGGAKA